MPASECVRKLLWGRRTFVRRCGAADDEFFFFSFDYLSRHWQWLSAEHPRRMPLFSRSRFPPKTKCLKSGRKDITAFVSSNRGSNYRRRWESGRHNVVPQLPNRSGPILNGSIAALLQARNWLPIRNRKFLPVKVIESFSRATGRNTSIFFIRHCKRYLIGWLAQHSTKFFAKKEKKNRTFYDRFLRLSNSSTQYSFFGTVSR